MLLSHLLGQQVFFCHTADSGGEIRGEMVEAAISTTDAVAIGAQIDPKRLVSKPSPQNGRYCHGRRRCEIARRWVPGEFAVAQCDQQGIRAPLVEPPRHLSVDPGRISGIGRGHQDQKTRALQRFLNRGPQMRACGEAVIVPEQTECAASIPWLSEPLERGLQTACECPIAGVTVRDERVIGGGGCPVLRGRSRNSGNGLDTRRVQQSHDGLARSEAMPELYPLQPWPTSFGLDPLSKP